MARGNWRRFAPGEILGAAEIISCTDDGGAQKTTWYSVRYTCCGREDAVSHTNLAKRLANGGKRCLQCWSGPNAKPPPPRIKPRVSVQPPPLQERYPEVEIKGVRCASGFWPKLGPMGFRSSSGATETTTHIRRGANRHTGKDVT